MNIATQIPRDSSVLVISDNVIRNEILRKSYESDQSKSLYVSLNDESQNIPLSCFNAFLYNLNYINQNVNAYRLAEILSEEYKNIYIQDIQFIDNESLKVLRAYVMKGGNHVTASTTFEGILKNSRSIVEIINLGFKILYYGKQGENFYPLSFLHGISDDAREVKFNIIPSDTKERDDIINNLSEEEVESIEEAKDFIYIIPVSYIKKQSSGLYKRMTYLVNKGIFKEDTFNITPIDPEILQTFGKRLTDSGKNIMINFSKEVEQKLDNKILEGILYYKAGLWNESASALRKVIDDLFNKKDYKYIINTIETLMKISELTYRDNYVYAVSLNYTGNTRRALKIFDSLMRTDYFENNPDDIAEYIKIIFDKNGFDKATKLMENYAGKMSKKSLCNLYLDLTSMSISDGDEAHVDYLLQKAYENLGSDQKIMSEYERMRGNLCLMRKDLKSALSHYQNSFDIAKSMEDYSMMAKAMNNIAILYSHDLKVIEGLKYFDESRKYALEIEDYPGYCITTANMIPLAIEIGDEALSFKFLNEIESLPRFKRDSIALSNAYYSISDIYLKRGDVTSAIEYITKGLNYSLEKLNNYEISSFLFKLAVIKIITGQDASLEIESARIYGDRYSEEYSYWESEISFYMGDIENARKLILKSFKDIEKSDNKEILMEDGIRLNLYELLINGKVFREDIININSKLPDINALKIAIKYLRKELDYRASELALREINSPFYYEVGLAIINGAENKSFISTYRGLMNVYNSVRKLFNH